MRANENAELTGVTTLLAREHNRIVAKLPSSLSQEEKFQIARRVVAAEEQYITYNEFLPALGVTLKPYEGYDPSVDPELSDEFAVIAYRAHSMVNGQERFQVRASYYNAAHIAALKALGVEVTPVPSSKPAEIELNIPQNAMFFNPVAGAQGRARAPPRGSLRRTRLQERRAVRRCPAQRPVRHPGKGTEPAECFAEPSKSGCFSVVEDLGAIDLQRARDAGMPAYNVLRASVGLAPKTTFTAGDRGVHRRIPGGSLQNGPDR